MKCALIDSLIGITSIYIPYRNILEAHISLTTDQTDLNVVYTNQLWAECRTMSVVKVVFI